MRFSSVCLLLFLAAPAYAEIHAATVTLAPYPGREGTSESGSLALAYANNTLTVTGSAANLTANCTDCGIHIHEGFSCETAGGHYWQSGDTDPWTVTKYTSDANGASTISISATMDIEQVLGRTIVLHDTEARIACGVIVPTLGDTGSMVSINAASGGDFAVATLAGDVTGTVTYLHSSTENSTFDFHSISGMGDGTYTIMVSANNCSATSVVDSAGKYSGWDSITSATTQITDAGYSSLEWADYEGLYLHIRSSSASAGTVSAGCGKFMTQPTGVILTSISSSDAYTLHVVVNTVSSMEMPLSLLPTRSGCTTEPDYTNINGVIRGFGGLTSAWPVTTTTYPATATYAHGFLKQDLPGYHPFQMSSARWTLINSDNVMMGCTETMDICADCSVPTDYCRTEDMTWTGQCCQIVNDGLSAYVDALIASTQCCPIDTAWGQNSNSIPTCTPIRNIYESDCGNIDSFMYGGSSKNCTDDDQEPDCDSCQCGNVICGLTVSGSDSGGGSSPASHLAVSYSLVLALALAWFRM